MKSYKNSKIIGDLQNVPQPSKLRVPRSSRGALTKTSFLCNTPEGVKVYYDAILDRIYTSIPADSDHSGTRKGDPCR